MLKRIPKPAILAAMFAPITAFILAVVLRAPGFAPPMGGELGVAFYPAVFLCMILIFGGAAALEMRQDEYNAARARFTVFWGYMLGSFAAVAIALALKITATDEAARDHLSAMMDGLILLSLSQTAAMLVFTLVWKVRKS